MIFLLLLCSFTERSSLSGESIRVQWRLRWSWKAEHWDIACATGLLSSQSWHGLLKPRQSWGSGYEHEVITNELLIRKLFRFSMDCVTNWEILLASLFPQIRICSGSAFEVQGKLFWVLLAHSLAQNKKSFSLFWSACLEIVQGIKLIWSILKRKPWNQSL